MARVDYYAIEERIKEVILDDEDARQLVVKCEIEDEVLFGAETTPAVVIYLDRRDAPADMQGLSAGQRTRFLTRFSIWCWAYSLEGVSHAIKLRDQIIGVVEIALMKDRSLKNSVNKSWLEGGEMPSARLPNNTGFISGGEIILVADVLANTQN